jgi:hypothetical protein
MGVCVCVFFLYDWFLIFVLFIYFLCIFINY